MKAVTRVLPVAFAISALAALASAASAQCVAPSDHGPVALMLRQSPSPSPIRLVALTLPEDGTAEYGSAAGEEPIVGFWSIKLIAKGTPGVPDGTVVDAGYSQWHSDGTEITNSTRPPTTQSFCLGVWEKAGAARYKLNHFAISWNANGTLLGPANLREDVTVSHDGNSFTGTFTIDQYDAKGTLVSHVAGQIEGKRITMSTTVKDVL